MRRTFLPLLLLSLGGGFASCKSSDGVDAPAEAGVEGESGIDKVDCPLQEDPPERNSPCDLPEGTTCNLGACGTKVAVCTHGQWLYGANPAPNPPCPTPTPPAPDTVCPECWPQGKVCTYYPSSCFSADASTEQRVSVASCVDSKWSFTYSACPISDGGADVQGDAGADGD
jgi:hypothetical protein